ncbi:MAG: hypothetical protein ACYCO3_03375 [Mycobacteriales bacterium]
MRVGPHGDGVLPRQALVDTRVVLVNGTRQARARPDVFISAVFAHGVGLAHTSEQGTRGLRRPHHPGCHWARAHEDLRMHGDARQLIAPE